MFRTLGLVSGKDVQRPAPFLPAGARFSDLIAVNDMVYTATSERMRRRGQRHLGDRLASDTKPVVSWKTNGGDPIGSVAFATNGTAIVAIGPGTVTAGGYANAIVALDPKTLDAEGLVHAARCRVRGAAGRVSGGWQGHRRRHDQGRTHSAARRRLSRRHESRHAALRVGVAHRRRRDVRGAVTGHVAGARRSPSRSRRRACCFIRADGGRWRTLAAHSGRGSVAGSLGAAGNGAVSTGAILGVKIAHQDGKFSVQPAWISQNIAAPLTPIVVNGVAFAVSGPSNAPAGLYALHGATGKTLWQSEKTIASPLSGRSFWVGSGHVFVGTRDGTVYAFGFAMERK